VCICKASVQVPTGVAPAERNPSVVPRCAGEAESVSSAEEESSDDLEQESE